ncbi:MAG: ABC transporter permease subunit [Treponema sp.]|jgi:NitT/TauT family transport system permease protein|nr:ABC transporter permease subunit [Treponema sp.]
MRGADFFWALLGVLALLIFWQAAALAFGSPLILPGPLLAGEKFLALVRTRRFIDALAGSFCRVMLGIAVAAPLGILAGVAAGLDRRAALFLKPLFTVISATPVMSVILIAFLILGQGRTPVFAAFLMIFPVIAANAVAGARSLDSSYRELVRVFQITGPDALRYLYLPGIVPYALAGLRSALSLCWKVVVAAEVLVQPLRSLGAGMQLAKARLETPELFAWTAATVLAAAFSQLLLSLAVCCLPKRRKPERFFR